MATSALAGSHLQGYQNIGDLESQRTNAERLQQHNRKVAELVQKIIGQEGLTRRNICINKMFTILSTTCIGMGFNFIGMGVGALLASPEASCDLDADASSAYWLLHGGVVSGIQILTVGVSILALNHFHNSYCMSETYYTYERPYSCCGDQSPMQIIPTALVPYASAGVASVGMFTFGCISSFVFKVS